MSTIVLTSPVPELVEEIATRVIVLRERRDPGLRHARRAAAHRPGIAAAWTTVLERLIFPETSRKLEAYFQEFCLMMRPSSLYRSRRNRFRAMAHRWLCFFWFLRAAFRFLDSKNILVSPICRFRPGI